MSNHVLDRPIAQLIGIRPRIGGEIGLEIETEGAGLPQITPENSLFWNTVGDGSLRNGGWEYIFSNPLLYVSVSDALKEWNERTKKAKFVYSMRTSIHQHHNLSTSPLEDLYKILAYYWLVENVLVRTQGPDREGNLHCLRIKDAEHLYHTFIESILERGGVGFANINRENARYAAANICALRKYGSLEYRFLKGTTDIGEIQKWVDILYNLWKFAIQKNSWATIYGHVLSDRWERVIEPLGMRELPDGWRQLIEENVPYFLGMMKTTQVIRDRVAYSRPRILGGEDLDVGRPDDFDDFDNDWVPGDDLDLAPAPPPPEPRARVRALPGFANVVVDDVVREAQQLRPAQWRPVDFGNIPNPFRQNDGNNQ